MIGMLQFRASFSIIRSTRILPKADLLAGSGTSLRRRSFLLLRNQPIKNLHPTTFTGSDCLYGVWRLAFSTLPKKENILMKSSVKRGFSASIAVCLEIDDVPCFYQPRGVITIIHEGLDRVQNNAVVQFSCVSASLS
jgi:hypothetical protein